MSMNRFGIFIILLLLIFSVGKTHTAYAELKKKPANILLITADDLGFDDLSVHKNPIVSSPNIDELANRSVRFSDFNVSPVCATTRASLLTGKHYYKAGVSGVHGGRDYLSKQETLISDILQNKGYATGTWGKWHLGKTEGYLPWDRGFTDAYYAELYQHENTYGFLNGERVEHNKWVSEVVTDYAINFMSENAANDKPFFAYVSYLAPHEPWLAPQEHVQPYLEKGQRPAVANLYGMISEMDTHIGRLMSFLSKSGLLDNTIVIFMSDNGPWWDSSNFGAMTKAEWQQRNPSKLMGNKGQSWQNGVKSPLFISYGKHFEPMLVDRFVNVQDITPTLVALTHTEKTANSSAFDGLSFVNYLQGNVDSENPRSLYLGSHDVVSTKTNFNQWTPLDEKAREGLRFELQPAALRTEKYKLLLNHENSQPSIKPENSRYQLFDMQSDPLETTNLIDDRPQVADKLKAQMRERFLEFKTDEDSFTTPEYIIGGNEQISVVNGFGPAQTSGNTISKAHVLSNLKAPGDSATYRVDIQTSACYEMYIKQRNTDSVGLQMDLTLQNKVTSFMFNGEPTQYMGKQNLSKSKSELTLQVVENKSIKPWTQLSGLRRILFIPCNSEVSVQQVSLPN
jgi:arylsulfatase A-like enzyme